MFVLWHVHTSCGPHLFFHPQWRHHPLLGLVSGPGYGAGPGRDLMCVLVVQSIGIWKTFSVGNWKLELGIMFLFLFLFIFVVQYIPRPLSQLASDSFCRVFVSERPEFESRFAQSECMVQWVSLPHVSPWLSLDVGRLLHIYKNKII